jgi:Tol biopolymer transport system component
MKNSHRTAAIGRWGSAIPLILFGVIVIAVTASNAGSARQPLPANGLIAFSTNREDLEIFTMNPDGSNQTNVTNNIDDDCAPSWSPDASRIAYTSGDLCFWDIYVMNANGSGQTNLTNSPGTCDANPAWSPDGTKIAFQSSVDPAGP